MFTTLLAIGVFAAIGYRMMTPLERSQFADQYISPAAAAVRRWTAETQSFRAALRTRTPWLVVTPTIAVVTMAIFFATMLGDDSVGGPETLLAWGATEVSRTAGGEWWRLVTAIFVHSGIFKLFVTLIGVVQVGTLVERLVGPLAVACVYVTAGAFGHAVRMATGSVDVHAGASAAIFGLYGVLLAGSAWAVGRRRGPYIPRAAYKLLAPGAVLLLVSSLHTDGLVMAPHVAGLAAGLIVGLGATMKVREGKVAWGPLALATVTTAILSAAVVMPVQDMVGVERQLSRLVAIEDRTADIYQQLLARSAAHGRRMDTRALTELIDRSIVPQLAKVGTDIVALDDVMPEYQPLVASARRYLRLREASWRLRAEGLRRGNMRLLQEADSMEQASIEALGPLRSPAIDDQRRPSKPHEG